MNRRDAEMLAYREHPPRVSRSAVVRDRVSFAEDYEEEDEDEDEDDQDDEDDEDNDDDTESDE